MFEHSKPETKKTQKNTVQKKESKPNTTGIPDGMKMQFENEFGFSFDRVKINRNSEKPAQLQALAYTQGDQIYIGPGQEKYLGHELVHVAQQMQGRVKPDFSPLNMNSDIALENEADIMSEKIMQKMPTSESQSESHSLPTPLNNSSVKQGVLTRSMTNVLEWLKQKVKTNEDFEEAKEQLMSHYPGTAKEMIDALIFNIGTLGSAITSDPSVESEEFIDNWDGHAGLTDPGPNDTDRMLASLEISDAPSSPQLTNPFAPTIPQSFGLIPSPPQSQGYFSSMPIQCKIMFKRNPYTKSGPKNYTDARGNQCTNVQFTTGNFGQIDNFANADNLWPFRTTFTNAVMNNSKVDLKNYIPSKTSKDNRSAHFAIADKLLAERTPGKKAKDIAELRKGKWTWHHLSTKYEMVLVDMKVHAQHGHNGGVFIWQ